MKPLAWGRLLRLSLAPSAAADAAAGLCLGHGGTLPLRWESLLLVAASLCVYHGGMGLNDWADRLGDLRTRPDRPLPSGAVDPRAALWVSLGLLVAGPALAFAVAPALGGWMALVAVLAAMYDLIGRGPWLGPGLLGACRALNLGAGVLAGEHLARVAWPQTSGLAWSAVGLYFAYVLFASRLGRLEDDEDERPLARRPSVTLALAAAALAALPLVAAPHIARALLDPPASAAGAGYAASGWMIALSALLPVALAGAGLLGLVRECARRAWTRALVGRATGMALRRLLVFTGSAALASGLAGRAFAPRPGELAGWSVCALILLGYPLSHALRRVFPPT